MALPSNRAQSNEISMLDVLSNFYQKYSADIGTIFIPSVALIFAALAYCSSRSNAKAARADQLTNLRMSVQVSFQEAQSSFSNLQTHSRQLEIAAKSEWARRAPKLSASEPSLFGAEIAEVKRLHEIEREGAALIQLAKEKLINLENLFPRQLEARFAEIKVITAQIDMLPMRLARRTG